MARQERLIRYKGVLFTLAELAAITGLEKDCLRKRCNKWGEIDQAIETPLIKNKNQYKKVKRNYQKKTDQPVKPDLFYTLSNLWQPCQSV
jgi:hypothetical protein